MVIVLLPSAVRRACLHVGKQIDERDLERISHSFQAIDRDVVLTPLYSSDIDGMEFSFFR